MSNDRKRKIPHQRGNAGRERRRKVWRGCFRKLFYHNITAIFLQKALYGLRESVEVIAKREDYGPLGPLMTQEELEARLADLPDNESGI